MKQQRKRIPHLYFVIKNEIGAINTRSDVNDMLLLFNTKVEKEHQVYSISNKDVMFSLLDTDELKHYFELAYNYMQKQHTINFYSKITRKKKEHNKQIICEQTSFIDACVNYEAFKCYIPNNAEEADELERIWKHKVIRHEPITHYKSTHIFYIPMGGKVR